MTPLASGKNFYIEYQAQTNEPHHSANSKGKRDERTLFCARVSGTLDRPPSLDSAKFWNRNLNERRMQAEFGAPKISKP